MLHTAKDSLKQHLLMSYFAAWAAILRGQEAAVAEDAAADAEARREGGRRRRRRHKQLPGGARGVQHLLQVRGRGRCARGWPAWPAWPALRAREALPIPLLQIPLRPPTENC